MSYTFYKLIHFSGIFLILLSLGALASHFLQGGSKQSFRHRKFFMSLHGSGLLLSFVAGFGLIAKTDYGFDNGWIYIKLLVWLALGMYPLIFYKQKENNKLPLWGILALLLLALVTVEYKFV